MSALEICFQIFSNLTKNFFWVRSLKSKYIWSIRVSKVLTICLSFLFRCYLFDNKANLITDPDFIEADNLDDSKYKGVTMGKKEGEVMKDLIYKHGFFKRKEAIDFQGVCSISPKQRKVPSIL